MSPVGPGAPGVARGRPGPQDVGVTVNGVLLLSGGVDSAVLLAHLRDRGETPLCVSFDYCQRHGRELRAAADLAAHYKAPRELVHLSRNVLAGSALTGRGALPGGVPADDPAQAATVVPARNAV